MKKAIDNGLAYIDGPISFFNLRTLYRFVAPYHASIAEPLENLICEIVDYSDLEGEEYFWVLVEANQLKFATSLNASDQINKLLVHHQSEEGLLSNKFITFVVL